MTSQLSVGGQPPGAFRSLGRDTISDGEYARKCRALMKLLRDLRNLGAHTVFDLPKIVVIGSQSAGKSSLIEAVTGITVPRDSGTCTRCPMECTMTSLGTSWTCTISLRYEGGIEDARGGSRPQRFGPADITNKRDVELWLRRAQAAVLSTDTDKAQWETKSADEIKQAIRAGAGMRMFTEDTIVVDIQDKDVTDLSFVDLPGLIQNSDEQSIELIKSLVRRHVAGENTLILVTMPVSDDIQNQGSVVFAKEADPDGRRTISVLTKPDMLGPGATGAHQFWKQTLENQNTPTNANYLRHGYYCVRLPDDKQRQRGYTAQNLPNLDYFDTTKPALLVRLMETNLPQLRTAVEDALRECNNRLGKLPPLPKGEPLTNIMMLITTFLDDLSSASVGDSHKPLAQDCRRRYNRLREDIEEACPEFRPKDDNTDDEDVINISDVRQIIQNCTAWELPGIVPYETYKILIDRFLRGWDEPVQACFDDVFRIFSAFIDKLSGAHFSSYHNLKTFVLSHARSELEKSKSEALGSVRKLLSLEGRPPFTQRSDFSSKQDHWTREYRRTFFGRMDIVKSRDEVHVMATVRTYFQFALEASIWTSRNAFLGI
ncbi:hypothetical protein P691DRAFT_763392 [Macrolepiota fuliginosa MF-IS2]|uniref:Dynamin-type G domain-containing protein n=1 Tax=Macrolepiota fuliginosa MF-IS2 TaxID=1400762 RepID=A0A9P5X6T3_9AGAR|nr:hypothetical protein P691DRAFT_763392 [Macrolepiota fuliginosa MF-IS2]